MLLHNTYKCICMYEIEHFCLFSDWNFFLFYWFFVWELWICVALHFLITFQQFDATIPHWSIEGVMAIQRGLSIIITDIAFHKFFSDTHTHTHTNTRDHKILEIEIATCWSPEKAVGQCAAAGDLVMMMLLLHYYSIENQCKIITIIINIRDIYIHISEPDYSGDQKGNVSRPSDGLFLPNS